MIGDEGCVFECQDIESIVICYCAGARKESIVAVTSGVVDAFGDKISFGVSDGGVVIVEDPFEDMIVFLDVIHITCMH